MNTEEKIVSEQFALVALKEFGYKIEWPCCAECKHYREITGVVDRTWYPACAYLGAVGLIELDTDQGTCNR